MTRQFVASPKGGISRVVRAADSKESTVATCNILQSSCRFNPEGSIKTPGRKEKLNADRFGYFVWNDRRCAVRWTVEGKCVVEKAYDRGTSGKEYS
jgi:hypothetical protein